MATLILLRHGQSTWNLENRFTGSVDVDLSPLGITEAKRSGILLKNYKIDFAFTSVLKRAIQTLEIVLKDSATQIPVFKSDALNERNYGDLQGLNKTETQEKFGVLQVLKWRRSFNVAPPNGESLKDTCDRVIPYYNAEIAPKLIENNTVLIIAHGNSLRALIMHLENISETSICDFEISTCELRVYLFDENLKIISIT
jgi:2,3-bisphosphoglycerate-dependent phosphoglycerate mutase